MPYSVGTNELGYLPDGEPWVLKRYKDAFNGLLLEIGFDLEYWATYSNDYSVLELSSKVKELEELKKDLLINYRSEGPFCGYANGRAYWIEVVSDEDYAEYEKDYL